MHEAISIRRVLTEPAGSPIPLHPESWQQPRIDFTPPRTMSEIPTQFTKLYLVPTIDFLEGEDQSVEEDFAPIPTSRVDLPDISEWVGKFVLTTAEIIGGRRPPMQLARWSQRRVFLQLVEISHSYPALPKIRKIYLQEPIDGVIECTVTLRFGERVRSLILRFEGVDQRWLCTQFKLL